MHQTSSETRRLHRFTRDVEDSGNCRKGGESIPYLAHWTLTNTATGSGRDLRMEWKVHISIALGALDSFPKFAGICKRPFSANIKRTAAFDFLSCLNLSGLIWVHPTGKHPQKNPSYCSRHLHIYSCVGIWQNDRVEIIPNDQGNRKTPSFVSFSDSECLIGDAAKNRAARNPHNTCVAVSF